MAATTMPRTSSLVDKVRKDFPEITFIAGDDFVWSAATSTITYQPLKKQADVSAFLHELAHARLEHINFGSDIELLSKEAEAWHYAQAYLAPRYNFAIVSDYIEDQLDSYRDWLHNRSLCPNCRQTGIQNATQMAQYNCLNCNQKWRVNDARRCALRRFSLN